jgi:Spy/CpxP family protein refolding chaperone
MSKLKVASYLLLIFLLGAVAGGTVGVRYGHPGHRPPPPHHDPDEMAKHIWNRMAERLSLTPDQVKTIEPIFRAGFQEIRAIQEKTLGQVDEAVKRNHQDIAKLLTAEQKEILQQMDREREEDFRKHSHGPHGPPPSGPQK